VAGEAAELLGRIVYLLGARGQSYGQEPKWRGQAQDRLEPVEHGSAETGGPGSVCLARSEGFAREVPEEVGWVYAIRYPLTLKYMYMGFLTEQWNRLKCAPSGGTTSDNDSLKRGSKHSQSTRRGSDDDRWYKHRPHDKEKFV